MSKDLVFVFCHDLDLNELSALRSHLLTRKNKHKFGVVEGDLSYVSAEMCFRSIGTPRYLHSRQMFEQDIACFLEAIDTSPADRSDSQNLVKTGNFDIDGAKVALQSFADLMSKHGFPWFVLSGTLLGIVRENGFLKHDYDIDVGIFPDEINLEALTEVLNSNPEFTHAGFDNQISFDTTDDGNLEIVRKPVFMKVIHKDGIHIDVFVHYVEGETTWHGSSLFRWDNSNFALKEYTLADVMVQGPSDADRYLKENYGDWRTPVIDFQSSIDTTNQQVVKNPLSVAIFLRRVWLSKTTNPLKADSLLKLLVRQEYLIESKDNGLKLNPKIFLENP